MTGRGATGRIYRQARWIGSQIGLRVGAQAPLSGRTA